METASSSLTNAWPSKFFWASLFILAGIAIVVANIGWLPWPSWSIIWQFWPLLLIIIGLHMLVGKALIGQWLVSISSLIAIIAVVLYASFVTNPAAYDRLRQAIPWLPPVASLPSTQPSQQLSLDHDQQTTDLTTRTINLSAEVGQLDLSTSSDQTEQVIVRSQDTSNSHISSSATDKDNQNNLNLDIQLKPGTALGQPSYQVILGQPSLTSRLNLDIGAAAAKVNLDHDFQLSGGTWQIGAGSLQVQLSSHSLPTGQVNASVGLGSLVIVVPAGTAVQAKAQLGLGSIIVFDQPVANDQTYTTDNYSQATTKLDIVATVGVGKIIIKTP